MNAADLPDEVHHTMTLCALRFDGWAWLERFSPGREKDFGPFTKPVVETLRLHHEEEKNFAAFFALQRWLYKWGGESLPENSPEHTAFRFLFLHLYNKEVPEQFRVGDFLTEWQREGVPQAEAHAALVRQALQSVKKESWELEFLQPVPTMSRQLREIASWSLASELTRRLPNHLEIIETHPGGGQYDCLSVLKDGSLFCDFNRDGRLHFWSAGETVNPMDIWARLADGENPRTLLDEICRLVRLPVPQQLPKSSPAVLTYRVIAALLKTKVFAPEEWRCVSALLDSSGEGSFVRMDFFKHFPAAEKRIGCSEDGDIRGTSEYRFWFFCREDEPLVCFETTGSAFTRAGKVIDLRACYKTLGSVAGLAALLEKEITD